MILFLSRLDPKKGLDLLLPAFAAVHARFNDAVLVIAGDGDPDFIAKLRQDAQRLGIEKQVLWPGFLTGEAKRAALANADLFVLPSYSENFGVAVVEAMGAGLPVIVTDQVGIHREISQSGAGLVVKCEVQALAAALTQAIADPSWRESAGRNAAQLASRFVPEIIGAQLAELYRQVRYVAA